jgi:hypothetical protein
MEGGRRAAGASDGDEKEGARRGASRHADQHWQPGVDVENAGSRCRGPQSNGGMSAVTEAHFRRRSSQYLVLIYRIDQWADRIMGAERTLSHRRSREACACNAP